MSSYKSLIEMEKETNAYFKKDEKIDIFLSVDTPPSTPQESTDTASTNCNPSWYGEDSEDEPAIDLFNGEKNNVLDESTLCDINVSHNITITDFNLMNSESLADSTVETLIITPKNNIIDTSNIEIEIETSNNQTVDSFSTDDLVDVDDQPHINLNNKFKSRFKRRTEYKLPSKKFEFGDFKKKEEKVLECTDNFNETIFNTNNVKDSDLENFKGTEASDTVNDLLEQNLNSMCMNPNEYLNLEFDLDEFDSFLSENTVSKTDSSLIDHDYSKVSESEQLFF